MESICHYQHFKKIITMNNFNNHKMDIDKIIIKLRDELHGENRKDKIQDYENVLCDYGEELSKNTNFFQLPLTNINSVFSKIDFNIIDESNAKVGLLQNFIKNTIESHLDEKETLFLLYSIDPSSLSLSFEEILSILILFTNCPILNQFCELCNEKQQLPEKDYEFEIQEKDKKNRKTQTRN